MLQDLKHMTQLYSTEAAPAGTYTITLTGHNTYDDGRSHQFYLPCLPVSDNHPCCSI